MNDSTPTSESPKTGAPARPGKAKLAKALPTDRVSFEKQSAIVRAYAAASGQEKKGVTNDEVATVMSGIAASSISICNPFFTDAGLLVQEGRKLRPVEAVFDLQHAHQWNAETAGLKLRPIFSNHWAAKSLLPKLAFRQLTKDEAIGFLAEESKAQKGHRKNLETLLDFLDYAGVIQLDGNTVLKANPPDVAKDEEEVPPPPPPPPPKEDPTPQHDPMIVGLFKKLPDAETEWGVSERIKWLRTAANIFDLVYTSDEGATEIEVARPKRTAPTTTNQMEDDS